MTPVGSTTMQHEVRPNRLAGDGVSAWTGPGAAAVYVATAVLMVVASVHANDGHFIYAQDDPYIHLALARNLAGTGVWGLARGQYAFASSSPGWTLLLAGLQLAGARASVWPFLLNMVAGVAVLVAADRLLGRYIHGSWSRFAILCALTFVTPLPTLAFVGMEHTAQLLVSVLLANRLLASLEGTGSGHNIRLGLLAAALTSLRYEGLFLLLPVAVVLLYRRLWSNAMAVIAGAALPCLAFGAYYVAHGGWWLPTSVMVKGSVLGPGAEPVLRLVRARLMLHAPLLSLLGAAATLLVSVHRCTGRQAAAAHAVLLVFFAAALVHVAMIPMAPFFRYEASLVGIGVIAVAAGWVTLLRVHSPAAPSPLRGNVPLTVVTALLLLPLLARSIVAVSVTSQGTTNIYQQQFQTARFLEQHFPGGHVMLNDIGAVSWFAPSVQIVDLIGLATPEVAAARRTGRFDTRLIDRLAVDRHVALACVFDTVFTGRQALPASWRQIGSWTIPRNVASHQDTVTFFAPSKEAETRLAAALDAFAATLPSGVRARLTARASGAR